jgi:hypothetical protein
VGGWTRAIERGRCILSFDKFVERTITSSFIFCNAAGLQQLHLPKKTYVAVSFGFPVTRWHITFSVTHNHPLRGQSPFNKNHRSATKSIQTRWPTTFDNLDILIKRILERNFVGVIQTCNSSQTAGHKKILNHPSSVSTTVVQCSDRILLTFTCR